MGKYFLINGQTIVNINIFKAFFIKFHQSLQDKHTNIKKIIIVKHAFYTWLFLFNEYHVIIYDNNYAVVRELHKISIQNDAMFPLQKIIMMIALNNISIELRWIFTYENEFTNVFSRRNFKKFADKYCSLQNLISSAIHSSNNIKKLI